MYNSMLEMTKFWYKEWYRKDVKANLTKEQKDAVMRRISDLTLEEPIWDDRKTDFTEQFPELKPYSHTRISGLELVAVMEEIFEELHGEISKPEGMRRTANLSAR